MMQVSAIFFLGPLPPCHIFFTFAPPVRAQSFLVRTSAAVALKEVPMPLTTNSTPFEPKLPS